MSKINNNRAKNVSLIIAATVFLGAACNNNTKHEYPNTKHEYPVAVADGFMTSCQTASGGNKEFCSCLLDKFQRRYTYEEFSALEVKMKAGQANSEFLDFMGKAKVECTKK